MDYVITYHTDIGIKKSTNQDAFLAKVANTKIGKIAFAVMCDGMGGLSKGEVASAAVIQRFCDWFHIEFPQMLEMEWSVSNLKKSWEQLIQTENLRIGNYGNLQGINLGTTLTTFLILNNQYYVMHVGDCRLYECTDALYQITKDQTVVAKEIEKGTLSVEQARIDPRRNILLQCIGASEEVNPEFIVGNVKENAVYILCTDGFRHEICGEEIWNAFMPKNYTGKRMKEIQKSLIEENKKRGETDNISVLTIKTC